MSRNILDVFDPNAHGCQAKIWLLGPLAELDRRMWGLGGHPSATVMTRACLVGYQNVGMPKRRQAYKFWHSFGWIPKSSPPN